MKKFINIILLLLSILVISNEKPLEKLLKKHRKLEVSATLNFIEAYDLIFENSKWSFKIRTDSELQNEANVLVDIFVVSRSDTTTSDTAYCTYNKKILSCTRTANIQYDSDLIKLAVIKNRGTIEWTNLRTKEVKITLNTKMDYIKSYGLFFANKWNFMIDAKTIEAIPYYSKVYIDILHNSVETTASCEILGNFAKYVTNISCVSDYEIQSQDDVIKINSKQKYGSVKWSSSLSSSQTKISEIKDYSKISVQFIEAYDLFYDNNKWVFSIHAMSNKIINPGNKYLIDINYLTPKTEQDFYASCLLKEGMKKSSNIIFLCACDYRNQGENDLIQIKYPKTETSTITWTTGISKNYKIILKTSLTLVKAYNLTFSNVWSFNLETTDGILPQNSKVIIDIYQHQTPTTVNCTSLNNTNIFCLTTITNNLASVSLSKEKSTLGSVDWKKNLQDDYRIYHNAQLSYRGTGEMIFNDTDNKWYFSLTTVSYVSVSKIKIDILYGEKSSTATCLNWKNIEFNCVVDEPVQNKKTLIKMNKIKSESSTVIWKDLDNNDDFFLSTDLTLSKTTSFLQINPKDQETWIFDLDVEEENLPENSIIIIDIAYIYTQFVMDNYADNEKKYSTAKCLYSYKKLNCEVDSSLKGHQYSIYFHPEKVEGSKSSVKTWKNIENTGIESLRFLLVTSLNYHYCTTIKLIEDKYIFHCHFHTSTPIPRYSEAIIDILVEDKFSTSYCKAEDFFNIECEIKPEDYRPQNIFVSAKKTRQSTITWNYIITDQYLFPIELEFFEAYNSEGGILQNQYPFNMLAKGDKLKDGLKFDVVVKNEVYFKCAGEKFNIEDKVPCEVYGGICTCWWYSSYMKIDVECDKYYLLLRSDGDDIKWTNPGNYNFMEDIWLRLTFQNLISINYNRENERYDFSLKVQSTSDCSNYNIILDLLIEKQPTYAHCQINSADNTIIDCITDKVKYKKATLIELRTPNYIGNVIWNGVSGKEILQGEGVYYVLIDKIYDLKFDSNQWKFIIKPLNIMPFEGTKQLDILINEDPGLANCNINNDNNDNLLICVVDSNSQVNSDLIRLYDNKDSESPIQIIDMQNDGIPFNINLEFIQAYDLKFDREKDNWFFKIKAKIVDTIVIPEGSTFSTGFFYEITKIIKEDTAFCTQDGNGENNIIILLCRPEYKKNETLFISLSGVNDILSSITWTNQISEDNLYILSNTKLNVLKVDNLKLGNKWTFDMYVSDLSDTELFIGSKIKIDLIYNNEEILGTCFLKSNNKFSCSPDYDNQQSSDIIIISPIKKNGNVEFINRKINLKFEVKLTYEKYYDLLFIDSKWNFKIKLSECDIEEGDIILIDILVDGLLNYAECTLNSNKILVCQAKKSEQNIKNRFKLINNMQNSFLKWTNLFEVVDMFLKYEINFINVFGGFHENKWKFNVYHEAINQQTQIYDNYVLLDILVNDLESTALCEITFSSFLKCVANQENQQKEDIIKIAGNKMPNLGTVYFEQNLNDDEKNINPLTLRIKFESVESEINGDNFEFLIKGRLNEDLDNNIEKDTVTGIEIISKGVKTEVVCLTNDIKPIQIYIVNLFCSTKKENVLDLEDISIVIGQNGFSKYIHLNTNDNIYIKKKDSQQETNSSQKPDTNESQDTETKESQKPDTNESQDTEKKENQQTDTNESQNTETKESQIIEENENKDSEKKGNNSIIIKMRIKILLLLMILTY